MPSTVTSSSPSDDAARRLAASRELGVHLRELTTQSTRLAHRFAHHHDIHATDFRAMTLIYDAERTGTPLSPSALADLLGLSSGAVTYLVERLVGAGHITRDVDPADKRRAILRFADHGRTTAAAYFGPLGKHLELVMRQFDTDEIGTAVRVLETVNAAMREFDNE